MKASGCVWNALTLFFLGLSLLACVWTGAVFMNPQGPFNPLKPPALDAVDGPEIPGAEGTPTEQIRFPTLPPEWTETFTPQATVATTTATLEPTETDTPEPTETVLGSPIGPTATQSETPIATRTPTRTPARVPPTATLGSYPATQAAPASPTSSSGYP